MRVEVCKSPPIISRLHVCLIFYIKHFSFIGFNFTIFRPPSVGINDIFLYINTCFQVIMCSLSLGSGVLSRHRPPSWSIRTPDTEVLKELSTCSAEFNSAKNKIQQTLLVDVDRVFRVENPYLFGEYNIEVTNSLLKTMH
jgi:hypothetical protein